VEDVRQSSGLGSFLKVMRDSTLLTHTAGAAYQQDFGRDAWNLKRCAVLHCVALAVLTTAASTCGECDVMRELEVVHQYSVLSDLSTGDAVRRERHP
jgi:hypothetical protein